MNKASAAALAAARRPLGAVPKGASRSGASSPGLTVFAFKKEDAAPKATSKDEVDVRRVREQSFTVRPAGDWIRVRKNKNSWSATRPDGRNV